MVIGLDDRLSRCRVLIWGIEARTRHSEAVIRVPSKESSMIGTR